MNYFDWQCLSMFIYYYNISRYHSISKRLTKPVIMNT